MEDIMKANILLTIGLAAPLLLLGACGESRSDRAISGGALGAGVGAVGGALTGSTVGGAVIGGAVGAGVGALTDSDDIDLGKPFWKR